MIEKGELVIARERRKPEREFCKLDRARVLVDAVEAALRDEAARVQRLVLVLGDLRPRLGPARPGAHQPVAERAAGLDQERARAHRGIADFEREHVLGLGVRADALEGGLQRMA